MMTVPTPAEFLASSEPDEEYDELYPMASFEHRLRMLESLAAELTLGQPVSAVLESAPCTDCADRGERLSDAREEIEDLKVDRADLEALIEQIEGIVKKSTSQVSLAVKAAIEAWRTPADTDTETPSPAPDASPSEPAVDEAAGPGTPSQDAQQASAGEGLPQPTADAPVEEWRAYARAQHGVTEVTVIDTMNRSQIRTMLGVEQPVTAVE